MKSTSSPSIAIALAVSLMSAGMAFAHVDSTAHAHPHAAVNGSSSFTGTAPFSSGTTPFAAGTGATVAYDRLRRDVEASQCLERAAYKQCLQRFCPKNDALCGCTFFDRLMTECTQEVVTSSGAKDTAADTADTASATCTLAETQAERDTLRRYAAAKCALAGYYLNVDNAKGMRVASARVNVTADDASAVRKAAVAVGLEEAFDKIRSRINGTSASSPSSSSSSLSSPNNNNKTSGAHPQFVHLPPGTLDDYRQTLLTSPCIRRDALSACLRQYCPENQVECGCRRFEEVVSACAAPGSPIFRVDGAASATSASTSDSGDDASDSFMEGVRIRTVNNNNTCSATRADKDREVLRRYTAAQCAIAGRPVLVTMDFFASTAPTVTVLNGTVPVNNRTAGGEPVDEPLPGSADATHGTMLSMVPVLAVVASLVM